MPSARRRSNSGSLMLENRKDVAGYVAHLKLPLTNFFPLPGRTIAGSGTSGAVDTASSCFMPRLPLRLARFDCPVIAKHFPDLRTLYIFRLP